MKYTSFFAGFVLAALLMFFLYPHLPVSPKKTKFKLSDPITGGTMELEVEGEAINYTAVLEEMFADDLLGPGAVGWLKSHQQMYRLLDESLVTAIESDLCDPIPKEPLSERLKKAKECAEKKVATGLRYLADHHKIPFHYLGIEARLGVPEDQDRPPIGHASVCRDGGLLDKTLEVINPASQRVIKVKATGSYLCTGYTTFPDLQLSLEDARKLFDRPIDKFETVIVVPLD